MASRKIQTPNQPANKGLAFIDLEASGLNVQSWPVEVGWAYAEGEPVAMLVAPEDSWPDEAWDDQAEALHGLSRDRLRREGAAPAEVCSALNHALAGYDVYSDAPEWDAFWLYRLFGAVTFKPAFDLRSYADLIGPLIKGREEGLIGLAIERAPRKHRAAADARHLQTLYRLAAV